MPHGPVEILIPEILGKAAEVVFALKASTLQDLGTGTLGEISIITFLTTAKPARSLRNKCKWGTWQPDGAPPQEAR